MNKIIGIDLGTTNSEVSVLVDGKPVVIDTGEGPILPSCVGIGAHGEVLVGQSARNQLTVRPEATILSIKRRMGSNDKVDLANRQMTPEEVSAIILGELKRRAETFLGCPATKAVITVPAYFNDRQRNATKDAGALAGLDVVRIINEPTAASLAYDAGHTGNEIVLVYDLGGGTFDASLVVIENGVVEVKASHGDTMLGGDDFDQLLLNHAAEILQSRHGIDPRSDLRMQRRLLVAVEKAKRTLSDEPFARVREEFLLGDAHADVEFSRDEYEGMIRPLIRKTLDSVHKCLRDASMLPSALDKIILVGGATRTPLVQRMLREEIGIEPRWEVNPDLIVSMGAAIQGATIAGEATHAVLVDITPYTFGTGAAGELRGEWSMDVFVPMIPRNTPLPAHKAEAFATMQDGQTSVEVSIYQGEEPVASHNTEVGSFFVQGLSNAPAGNMIILNYDLDLNGILKVTAVEKKTGLSKTVTVDTRQSHGRVNLDDARRNIVSLIDDAAFEDIGRDEPVNAAPRPGAEAPAGGAVVRAKELRRRAEKLAPTLKGDDAAEIARILEASKVAVTAGDHAGLEKLNESLADILFYLED